MFDKKAYDMWLKQAVHTLESAERDLEEEDYDWACFKAQQAAEYAVKAFLYGIGIEAWGHSITRLLGNLEMKDISVTKLLTDSRLLDRHYIPTRYANAHIEAPPMEYYDRDTSYRAILAAKKIMDFIKNEVEKWQSK
ncbi:MAG: HEPN domain-containing protein [Candidatus Ranarchaeia archaeon]